jgi:RNA polymerase sigma factor (sigma-70 family)
VEPDLPDEELLVLARRDPEAFAAVYRRYETAVLAFFARRVGNAELAADLAAETFAQALSSIRNYRRGRGPAAAWLFGIARHVLARSVQRLQVEDRARRRLKLPALVLTDEAVDAIEALAGGEVADLLAHLPADQRVAVEARIVDDRSYADIAGEMRCSESVVRKRVSRGLATLREQIEEAG